MPAMPLFLRPLRPALTLAALLGLGLPLAASAVPVAPAGDLGTWACSGQCGALGADGDITRSPLANPAYGFVTTSGSGVYGASPVQVDGHGRGSGAEANGSKIVSGAFSAAAQDTLSVHLNFVSTDGSNYDDYAWARIVDANSGGLVAWLFTAQSNNGGSGKIVPGQVVDKSAFDPDLVIVDFDNFSFNSRPGSQPVNWSPLGPSNHTCWDDNAEGCGFTGWLQARHVFAAAGSYRLEVGVVNWGDELYDSGLAFDLVGLSAAVPEPGAPALMLAGLALLAGLGRRGRPGAQRPARAA